MDHSVKPTTLDSNGNDSAGTFVFAASYAQQRLWFLSQLQPNDATYHIVNSFRLRGELDLAAFQDSINAIVARHESLRTAFGHSVPARVGYVFARGSLKKLGTRLDPRRYNGALFLGLAGIAVKSHGSTDAFGFANAIGVAADVKRYGLLEKIIDEMARLNAAPAGNSSGVVTASI